MIKKIGKVLTGQPEAWLVSSLPTYVTYNNFDKPLPTKSMSIEPPPLAVTNKHFDLFDTNLLATMGLTDK
jgi:hypothetical protein